MSEIPRLYDEATVLFRRGTDIAIPPIGLPRERRLDGEGIESTLLRLSLAHGVQGKIDRHIPQPIAARHEAWPRAYLIEPRNGEFDLGELFVPHDEVVRYLNRTAQLSRVDHNIVLSAWQLLASD